MKSCTLGALPSQRITVNLSQKTLTYDPSGDVEAILDHEEKEGKDRKEARELTAA